MDRRKDALLAAVVGAVAVAVAAVSDVTGLAYAGAVLLLGGLVAWAFLNAKANRPG